VGVVLRRLVIIVVVSIGREMLVSLGLVALLERKKKVCTYVQTTIARK
jgi:hypothetical protein